MALGLDPEARAGLKRRLREARLTCPLFDTAAWVRGVERALVLMWEAHCSGQGPQDIDVSGEWPGAA